MALSAFDPHSARTRPAPATGTARVVFPPNGESGIVPGRTT
jgi:hypothetical protein